ncbi:SDR family NAD(P)-dependent oxidoreductase [Mycolicibacterium sp. CBM1]
MSLSAAPAHHLAADSALEGKVAVVSGAASGIGRAIALAFVAAGARVAALDVDATGLQRTRELAAVTDAVLPVPTDVSDGEAMAVAFEATRQQFGPVTTLVNNAAISIPGTALDTRLEDFDRTIDINVRGYLIGCQLALPQMLANGGGSIINMGSVNSLMAERQLFSYCVSKGAVLMMTKSLALDFASAGVRCNCICPGWVDTPINLAHAERLGGLDKVRATLPQWMPVEREGRPDEIASMAVWLASDASSFATGAAFTIDGGMTAGL